MEHRIYFNMLLPTRQWLFDESADSMDGPLRTVIDCSGCGDAATSAMVATSSGLDITVSPTWSTVFILICCRRRGGGHWIVSTDTFHGAVGVYDCNGVYDFTDTVLATGKCQ